MNVFASLKSYAGKWSLKSSRKFDLEEINAVDSAKVVASQSGYGNSVMFIMKTGTNHYIPCSNDCTLAVGESVDLTKAEILTLEKQGESDILRIKA
ncbi:hypothetical protein [uncultured phage cr106_1]|uniref:Uncharacterized protein n=1 Tax=uncultured phage cr106_1 TaxID=2772062 RepID=A0A7M1RV31_9CAUD|nr:hypothetical protein KNV29_gp100 [uncultured phage cr106_1]QOR58287.1 hypothetical protein [uncultured phage cr106_1]